MKTDEQDRNNSDETEITTVTFSYWANPLKDEVFHGSRVDSKFTTAQFRDQDMPESFGCRIRLIQVVGVLKVEIYENAAFAASVTLET